MKTRGTRRVLPLFVLDELIGQEVVVEQAPSRNLVGLKGKILDETRETFLLRTAKGDKMVPKAGTRLYFPAERATVQGDVLRVRPEERTKRLARLVK